jgi:hypothetical protein
MAEGRHWAYFGGNRICKNLSQFLSQRSDFFLNRTLTWSTIHKKSNSSFSSLKKGKKRKIPWFGYFLLHLKRRVPLANFDFRHFSFSMVWGKNEPISLFWPFSV